LRTYRTTVSEAIDVAFQRDGQAARGWFVWLDCHRDTLVRCGIPDFLYGEERRWLGFLEEDGWDAETGWRVEMLAPQQAVHLQDFIIREYGPESYRGLLRALRSVTLEP
jgi:hypothetical protein